ncbi:hypothetical protein PR048_012212 [Dryococelus australis]|uniref:DUF5641 domain-containing protein n=1 Tax=Dryococelus australis TaxID=614101 RepID=A0ABQ9HNQ3_9NEOP|nr:hypothetical protein PR048_012212 [Dryococelus australis]
MLTVVPENVAALEALKIPVQHWDLILLPILCRKLDVPLQTQWEIDSTDTELPTCKSFVQFLEKHCRAMEAVASIFRPAPSKIKPVQVSAELAKGYQSSSVFMHSHQCRNCPSEVSCHHCKSRHHSLLYFPEPSTQEDVSDGSGQSINVPDSSLSDDTSSTVSVCSSFLKTPSSAVVMLSTATGTIFSIDALVLPCITGHLPSAPVDVQAWNHLVHLQLADPAFATPGSSDMLLGAELIPYLLKGSKCEGPSGTPVALNVHFGWIVMGKVDSNLSHLQSSRISSFFVASSLLSPSLDTVVERLWKLEELPPDKPTPSPDDVLCEKLFAEGYACDENGRYSVVLPFKSPDPDLGNSCSTAFCFHSLERHFKRQPDLKADYQRILWRESEDQPLKVYRLNTVTYGVSSAPFLTLKALHQLAEDENGVYVSAASVLLSDTYVDAVDVGTNDVTSAVNLRRKLQQLLSRGGFQLHKFTSNCPAVLEGVCPEDEQLSGTYYSFDEDQHVKVLGLQWNPSSDTFVALSWIKTSSHVWNTFVGNRVREIQSCTSVNWWHHVPSEQNPADCASRGLTLLPSLSHIPPGGQDLPGSVKIRSIGHRVHVMVLASPAMKSVELLCCRPLSQSLFLDLMERESKLNKSNCVADLDRQLVQQVQLDEMKRALNILIKISQIEFAEEFARIAKHQPCSPFIQKLAPFVDSEGILTMLQSLLQREFWVLGARNFIRSRLYKCIHCFQTHPKPLTSIMGCLPAERVSQAKPFMNTGVDYGGLVSITMARLRKSHVLQAYICLFVCFATKAIHLELVSDLSTEAFLAAFRRFVARRGQCANIYSDVSTNFVGASHQLEEVQNFLTHSDTCKQIVDSLAEHKITWRFNPQQLLTSVDFGRQATLNSRPLCPLSSVPNDFSVLTPSHFLTMGPAQILPELDISTPVNRLTRWSLLQQIPPVVLEAVACGVSPSSSAQDQNLPTLWWKLGRIVNIHPGADGVVRIAEVPSKEPSPGQLLSCVLFLSTSARLRNPSVFIEPHLQAGDRRDHTVLQLSYKCRTILMSLSYTDQSCYHVAGAVLTPTPPTPLMHRVMQRAGVQTGWGLTQNAHQRATDSDTVTVTFRHVRVTLSPA